MLEGRWETYRVGWGGRVGERGGVDNGSFDEEGGSGSGRDEEDDDDGGGGVSTIAEDICDICMVCRLVW